MDNVIYLTEIQAPEKHNKALGEALKDSYGVQADVSVLLRVPKGKNSRDYVESITTFNKSNYTVNLHEFLKIPGGLTDYVTLSYEGSDRRFNTYIEAEKEVINILRKL